MLIETLGLPRDAIGEDSQIVSEALGHDVEVASSLFEVPPGFFCLPGDVPSDQFELSVDSIETAVDGLKTPIDGPKPAIHGSKTLIDRSEARVHRSFELGDGHGLL